MGSLSELRDAIIELDRQWSEPIWLSRYASTYRFKVATFGGKRPRYCLTQYHQRAVDAGLFYQTRRGWNHDIVSWDENSVLFRGARGLLLMSREEFEGCFSDIVCPFCGERYIVHYGCEHAMAINDQVLEFWHYRNAEEVYRAWLNEHMAYKNMPKYGSEALPGTVVASCRMQGPAYRRWESVRVSILFAPEELLRELRARNREQWKTFAHNNEKVGGWR